jgi:tetraacyldisaccharide 4'-kinase
MPFTAPKFWYQSDRLIPYFLDPIGWLYRGGAMVHKWISKPSQTSVPVISVGNFVLGGAGKTPVTIAIAESLIRMGRNPHIISRGYGGALRGPIRVNPDVHRYSEVGDEPLLLAKVAPTWVSINRAKAAPEAIRNGADILILDDAHQNYSLKKDMSFMVVNGNQNFGNGHVFPAGPLRQSFKSGLEGTTAIIFIGNDNDSLPEELKNVSCPIIRAQIVPQNFKPGPVIGFAGIGYPEKFRQTLIDAGYTIKAFVPFPDHYPYKEDDLRKLRMRARVERAALITTEKDVMRIHASLREGIETLSIGLQFQSLAALEALLKQIEFATKDT